MKGEVISAAFLMGLLKRHKPVNQIYGDVNIVHANISGALEFQEMDVPYKIVLSDCTFDSDVDFSGTKFQKDLDLSGTKFQKDLHLRGGTFEGGAVFYKIKVGGDLIVDKVRFNSASAINFDSVTVKGRAVFYESKFSGRFILSNSEMNALDCARQDDEFGNTEFRSEANFFGIKVHGDANFTQSYFDDEVNFEHVDIAGDFELSETHFTDSYVSPDFFSMKVGGNVFLNKAQFQGGFNLGRAVIAGELEMRQVCAKKTGLMKDLSVMKVDALALDTIPASPFSLEGTEYRFFNWQGDNTPLQLVKASTNNQRPYSDLEAYYRRIGDLDTADAVYREGKQAERQRLFRSFSISYISSWFLWVTVGYGKRPWLALLWSFGFIVLGRIVFFRRGQMMLQKKHDEVLSCGKYNPFWYSIALFLPIVDLGDAKTWMPKRAASCHYRRIHIILGYLLIPIGLAAWTGLIK